MVAICVSGFGLLGNFIIYLLSRFIEVMVPRIRYEDGEKIYHWSWDITGRSYRYFIQAYDLEALTLLFWGLFAAGVICLLAGSPKVRAMAGKMWKRRKQKKTK